jgi:hypothetical protein
MKPHSLECDFLNTWFYFQASQKTSKVFLILKINPNIFCFLQKLNPTIVFKSIVKVYYPPEFYIKILMDSLLKSLIYIFNFCIIPTEINFRIKFFPWYLGNEIKISEN